LHKMAIFVEGPTELIFLRRLLEEIAGKGNISFTAQEGRGKLGHRKIDTYRFEKEWNSEWYVLLVTSCNDEQVTSDVNDRYDSLIEQGFEKMLALRDVRPRIEREEISNFQRGFDKYIKATTVKPVLVLAVMEIEAWFLAEHTHFERIDPLLTLSNIKDTLKFDPSAEDVEIRPIPSADVKAVYKSAGHRYDKSVECVKRTVNCLDMASIYVHLPARVTSIGKLTAELDSFFTN
jgi:hypothetical protein